MDTETRLHLALDMLKEVIERDEDVSLKTTGFSMRPFICSGEWIVVRQARPEEVRVGDVVIYQTGSIFIAHRVIRQRVADEQRYFTVKGDAHLSAEGEVADGEVVARVVALVKGSRTIDLNRPRWRRVNRWIARFSAGVDALYTRMSTLPGVGGRGGGRLLARWAGRLSRLTTRLLIGPW
jgi:signal peptidase I